MMTDPSTGMQDKQRFYDCVSSGLEKFKEGLLDDSIALFDKALSYNSVKAPQPLSQRGIALYLAGDYERANIQLKQDIEIIEDAKLYKASDLRLWRCATLNKMGLKEDALQALDVDNLVQSGLLYEDKFVMNSTLNFYAGRKTLEDMIEVIGSTEEKDLCGNSFFGNFYLGLFFDSTDQVYLAKTFISIPLRSMKYPSTDMWYHIPKLLVQKRGFQIDKDDDAS
jgi:tetratricopeptide (TPR) repeat protein